MKGKILQKNEQRCSASVGPTSDSWCCTSVSVVCSQILWFRAGKVFWFSQMYRPLNVSWRPSGRCLGSGGSSWSLFSENRLLLWTQPSRLRPGIGSDSVPLCTKPRSDLNGHKSCTTSLPSGNGHSYLEVSEKQQQSSCVLSSKSCMHHYYLCLWYSHNLFDVRFPYQVVSFHL